MVALGELEPIDAAIHADTTHERSATYEFAQRWTPWLEAHNTHVVTVNDARQAKTVTTLKTDIPAFTNTPNKDMGMLRRQCTQRWKIVPIRRWLQNNRDNESIEQWIGISLDESERMRPSDRKYITHRWPLIEKRMSRDACVAWLTNNNLEVPVKSACVFCPFQNRSTWYQMKRENGPDWQKAIATDKAIRKVRPPFDLFVHPDRIPLADIRSPQDNGQLELWSEECTGICGV